MDVISVAASGITLVDAATRLAQACFKLYQFWESMRDAPAEVKYILHDLDLVGNILRDISNQKDLVPSVSLALSGCMGRVSVLEAIVGEFDSGLSQLDSRRERLWTAFRFTGKDKKLQKFRESLIDAKQNLMLGLMYQNIQRPRLAFTNLEAQLVSVATPASRDDPEQQLRNPILAKGMDSVGQIPEGSPPAYSPAESPVEVPAAAPPITCSTANATSKSEQNTMTAIASSKAVQKFLQQSLHMAVDNLFASGTVQQLMDSTLNQVTSFDSITSGTYTADGYDLHPGSATYKAVHGVPEERSRPDQNSCPRLSRSRTCHRTSSMGVLLGSIWVRTSTLKTESGSCPSAGKLEVVTSFIFYPAPWLTRIGLGYGTEANLNYSATGGWKFNITPVRAVPENALIFDLCRRGETQAVKLMLERGDASFAAATGHVDLCAALIDAGADKSALAYEGPTQDALSPVTIFAESAQLLPASEKIRMLRLFADTLDLTDASGDGWTVISSLVKAIKKESVPMNETSVNWVLRLTGTESVVAYGAKSVWDALQHAVRSFLSHEQDSQVLRGLLELQVGEQRAEMQSKITAMAHWLALRASQRELLPMVIEGGRLLKMEGFDWVDDKITPREYIRAQPAIYAAWSKTMPSEIERLGNLVEAELESVLDSLCISREQLREAIASAEREEADYASHEVAVENAKVCGDCQDSYVKLGAGLVRPRLITFNECRKTGHKARCRCAAFLREVGVSVGGRAEYLRTEDESDVDEEVPGSSDTLDRLCEAYDALHFQDARVDPFQDAATLLYRAQARRWLSEYGHQEVLCATCFLKRELYIGRGGQGLEHDATPMPESYGAFALGYLPTATVST
ncbi:hypothetical protein DL765_005590 [Monosporascus sp. GIB2]|nr:hypothetical protein DL765_005590 [Monosporascus sp. GIB2]